MTNAHTPGPWYVMPNGVYVGDKKVWFDEDGARCGETPNILIDCLTDGNASLVAAAPELLAVLKSALKSHDYDGRAGWVEEARAAIAKAEGR